MACRCAFEIVVLEGDLTRLRGAYERMDFRSDLNDITLQEEEDAPEESSSEALHTGFITVKGAMPWKKK